MSTINTMFNSLILPNVTGERAEILGRNMWRYGLMVQAHRLRVEDEETALKQRHMLLLRKAQHQKVAASVSGRMVKDRARRRKRKALAEEQARGEAS